MDPIERTTASLAAYEGHARRCFAATDASSDSPWTPSVKAWSRSLHLVLWFEDKQIPAVTIIARKNMFMLMDTVCLGGRNSVQG